MKQSYAQNGEDLLIKEYFGTKTGTLLSIGENNGFHLSNVYGLIQDGWRGYLVEPSPSAFDKLAELHKDNGKVVCIAAAVSDYNGVAILHDSGPHLNQGDASLLSTLNEADRNKWQATTDFTEIFVPVISVETLLSKVTHSSIDLISIDTEGNDILILRQLPLVSLKTKLVVIEWNSDDQVLAEMDKIFDGQGFSLLHKNQENVLYAINY